MKSSLPVSPSLIYFVKVSVFVSLLLVDPAAEGFSANLLPLRCQNSRANKCGVIDNIESHQAAYRHTGAKRGVYSLERTKSTWLHLSNHHDNNETTTTSPMTKTSIAHDIQTNPKKSIYFSLWMIFCGASLGPFLDSYHSLIGVLTYNTPLIYHIIGKSANDVFALTCVTTYWVPPLFGLAGFIIGWLYVMFDALFEVKENEASRFRSQLYPAIPKVLIGISYFTFQYWLSGVLFANDFDRSFILIVMSAFAAGGFCVFDMSLSGFLVSAATAIGGPLIEIGLLSLLPETWAYHYNDYGETGYFPLWIIPVYFLGGPANGNLARFIWNSLAESELFVNSSCSVCQGSRAVPCPICDDGTYITYGQRVRCRACRGKGRVICRRCFHEYGTDPNDIENIRQVMDQIPD